MWSSHYHDFIDTTSLSTDGTLRCTNKPAFSLSNFRETNDHIYRSLQGVAFGVEVEY